MFPGVQVMLTWEDNSRCDVYECLKTYSKSYQVLVLLFFMFLLSEKGLICELNIIGASMILNVNTSPSFRGCDGKGSLYEPHGGAGLWHHRPGTGPPASGRPRWAWAGTERLGHSYQSLPGLGDPSSWAGIPWNKSPLLIQTWAMKQPQLSFYRTPCLTVQIHFSLWFLSSLK